MERFKRILRMVALVCLMLLASVGIGLTGAAPVYSKERNALSDTRTEQGQVIENEQFVEENVK